MRGAFAVDAPGGERWDLAIQLLEGGEGLVRIGKLLIYRDAIGPRADGRLHVEICTSWQRDNLTMERAEAEIESGLRQLEVLLTDARLAQLAEEHALMCEFVEGYEIGRSPLGVVNRDGSVTWTRFTPNP